MRPFNYKTGSLIPRETIKTFFWSLTHKELNLDTLAIRLIIDLVKCRVSNYQKNCISVDHKTKIPKYKAQEMAVKIRYKFNIPC